MNFNDNTRIAREPILDKGKIIFVVCFPSSPERPMNVHHSRTSSRRCPLRVHSSQTSETKAPAWSSLEKTICKRCLCARINASPAIYPSYACSCAWTLMPHHIRSSKSLPRFLCKEHPSGPSRLTNQCSSNIISDPGKDIIMLHYVEERIRMDPLIFQGKKSLERN
jgi:hypothetical protein